MTRLFLVRHAQASFGAADYDQLSKIGQQQSRWLGGYLAERAIHPQVIVTGSLRRHAQTWHGIAHELAAHTTLAVEPKVDARLNEYDPERLIAAYRHHTDAPRSAEADPTGASAVGSNAQPPANANGGASAQNANGGAKVQAVTGDPADPEVRKAHFRTLRLVLTAWAEGTLSAPDHLDYATFRNGALAALLEAWQAGREVDGDVVVVSSGGPIASILAALFDMPATAFVNLNLHLRNASYAELQGGGRRPNVLATNGITHLDTPQRRAFITFA